MNERMKFVLRIEDGEKMVDLCHEFGISRKTGYKIWNRFKEDGPEGLYDRSSRPRILYRQTDSEIEKIILDLKKEKPTWGAPKVLEYLKREYNDIKFPARSTVHAILDRHGLVKKRKRRRFKAEGTNLNPTRAANDLWCADYKGQFKLKNGEYCYPLTISDHFSRYIIKCEALESTQEGAALEVFKQAFREYGIPHAIRTDNGVPFSTRALFGLSKLSVWWLRLGIKIERIAPGHPEQNGRHERMHLTLKEQTVRPAGINLIQQQEKFDYFIEEFNKERPHEGLEMKVPLDYYQPSTNKYPEYLAPLEYPYHDRTLKVSKCGLLHLGVDLYLHIGRAFAGEQMGLQEVEEQLWRITFMNTDIGYFDERYKKFESVESPLPF